RARRAGGLARRGAARAALLARLPSHLARLPVGRVRAAPAAVLLQLDPVRRVPPRLVRLVVAPPALGAGERDRDSGSGFRHGFSTLSCSRAKIAAVGLEPTTRGL